MLYLHLRSPHIVCRPNSQMIVWMQCTFVQQTHLSQKDMFADLQLATQSSKPKYLKVRLDTAADVSMMSKSVYQQLFDDLQCQKLQPVTTNTDA